MNVNSSFRGVRQNTIIIQELHFSELIQPNAVPQGHHAECLDACHQQGLHGHALGSAKLGPRHEDT